MARVASTRAAPSMTGMYPRALYPQRSGPNPAGLGAPGEDRPGAHLWTIYRAHQQQRACPVQKRRARPHNMFWNTLHVGPHGILCTRWAMGLAVCVPPWRGLAGLPGHTDGTRRRHPPQANGLTLALPPARMPKTSGQDGRPGNSADRMGRISGL